jgi:hypothetical protein
MIEFENVKYYSYCNGIKRSIPGKIFLMQISVGANVKILVLHKQQRQEHNSHNGKYISIHI